jgi:hypothetical protein
MTIPLSEVKAICTGSELALVSASRKPKLERLTLAEARKAAQLARKLFDKWQDQNRGQARTRSRRIGYGELDNRTQLKVRIFRDALHSFEARVSQLESEGSAVAGKSSAGTPKKVRSLKHRATRAAVRAQLAEKETSLNATVGASKKRSDKPKPAATGAAPRTKSKATNSAPDAKTSAQSANEPPTTVAKKKKAQRLRKPAAAAAQQRPSVQPTGQLAAATAAKKSRIARSGLTTRVRGHVSGRGKRAQGRRDARRS